MANKAPVNLFDLLKSIAVTIDLIGTQFYLKHIQVAYIANRIAEELNLPQEQRYHLTIAAMLRDIGTLSLNERIALQNYTVTTHGQHCHVGYYLLGKYPPFDKVANIIRFHHTPWEEVEKIEELRKSTIPIESHILHLADRIAVQLVNQGCLIEQAADIQNLIAQDRSKRFKPEVVDVFLKLSFREHFWLDLESSFVLTSLMPYIKFDAEMSFEELLPFSEVIRELVDFRSEYTIAHTAGVTAVAEKLAQLFGFSELDCLKMSISGNFHDWGKFAIPSEIIEKPIQLSIEEFNVIRAHPYYTYQALNNLPGLEVIRDWAGLHHERLNGTGYPYGLTGDKLSTGSRILAVADVYAAITEDRPHRDGRTGQEALEILAKEVEDKRLDADIVNLIKKNFEEIDAYRKLSQEKAQESYQDYIHSLLYM